MNSGHNNRIKRIKRHRINIRGVRVERAKLLLTSTDLSVGEIAERLRFSSSSHFSDTFRRLTGMLPQAYRQEHMRM